jgi:hypothetical protein
MTADTLYCARHSDVETGLRCGRCETPICPKCAVFTDVGARCPDCAPTRKLPQFEVGPRIAVIGALTAIGVGALAGVVWGFLLPDGFGFFSIFLGMALGYLMAEVVSRVVRGKSGPVVQGAGVAGVIVAYLVHNIVAGYPLFQLDYSSLLILAFAAIAVVGRLRF